MTRNLSTAVKNHLATNDIKPVHLITLGFSTPQNITDCTFDFTEETDITKTSLSLTLSGADQTFISLALNENLVNDSVEIYRAFLDDSNAIINTPFLLYKGYVDTFAISENKTESNLNLNIVSHWADFEKISGRKTNNNSQQKFFSTDVGFDFASQTVLDIKWGRA